MGSKRVNWGVLGAAEIAREQVIPAIARADNSHAYALASQSGQGQALAAQYDFDKAYDDYDALLADPLVDAVYIPLPNDLHANWTITAARAGKHVLCEKPAALSAAQARQAIAACQEHGVLFMEALMYQFHPQHERARALVRTGEIGAIRGVNVSLTFNLVKLENNFRLGTIETGGGSLYDLACYCIHAIRKLLGEPAHAAAFGRYDDTGMVDWSTVAVLGYADGLKAGFDCGMDATGRHRYEIIGTQGTLRVLKAFVPQADGEGLIEITDNEGQVRHERVVADFYREGVAHFADCILSGRCPAHSPADTLANMRVLDACIAALQNKAVTPVSGPEPSP